MTDTKLKTHTQHPQHHSIGAASVLSPKGSMTNPVNTLVMSKDQKLKYDMHQGSLNNKKQIKNNQAYDDLRYKLQQQQPQMAHQQVVNQSNLTAKNFSNQNTTTFGNFNENQRRIGLSVNSCIQTKVGAGANGDLSHVIPPSSRQVDQNTAKSLHHQEVTSLESFKPNRAGQPAGMLQQSSPYPSFIHAGKPDPSGKSEGGNSTLPQLVQKPGNAS